MDEYSEVEARTHFLVDCWDIEEVEHNVDDEADRVEYVDDEVVVGQVQQEQRDDDRGVDEEGEDEEVVS
jgi:hypothetical protein